MTVQRLYLLIVFLVSLSFFLVFSNTKRCLQSTVSTNYHLKPYPSSTYKSTYNTIIPVNSTCLQSSILIVDHNNLSTKTHVDSSLLSLNNTGQQLMINRSTINNFVLEYYQSPPDINQRYEPPPLSNQQPPKCKLSLSCIAMMIIVTIRLAKSITTTKPNNARSTASTSEIQHKHDKHSTPGKVQPQTNKRQESGKVHSHHNFQRFDYNKSLKNIPIPPKNSYRKLLLAKTFDVIERIRWKVFFFLNPDQQKEDVETFGFRTAKSAPKNKELDKFEDELIELVSNPKFKDSKPNPFQKELQKNVKEINNSKDVFLLADKTTNIYKISPEHYNTFLNNNITKDYKKAQKDSVLNTNIEAKHITERLNISDRVEVMSEQPAYLTLKDHKDNFENAPKFRLINPAKTQIGKISKQKLDDINSAIRDKLQLQQWKNTHAALSWFQNLKYKKNKSFLQFDIVEFYPSISEKLLKDALAFANKIAPQLVDSTSIEIILHARKAFLFSENNKEGKGLPNSKSNTIQWTKKSGCFDVTMGASDGAEVCDLVGLFLLNSLRKQFPELNIGLYRDDGLAAHGRIPGPRLERIRKDIHKFFGIHGLKCTVETNMKVVNFLDVTMNLNKESFEPYRKPNDTPLYVHTDSNHPKSVIKEIPRSVNKRLSMISIDENTFESAKGPYQKAMTDSGHKHKLVYDDLAKENKKQPKTVEKKRKRHIIWYNPPYNQAVSTNIGKRFLELIDKHFPKDHILRKCINRNCVKMSYSCTKNMKQIIMSHNRKVLKPSIKDEDTKCRCRNSCALNGACRCGPIVYKATVEQSSKTIDGVTSKTFYVGSTQEFKTRLANHESSFRKENPKNTTTLSKHIWKKNLGPKPDINWEILTKAFTYNKGGRYCDLCLSEALTILDTHKNVGSLNQRHEWNNKCSHKMKFRLNRLKHKAATLQKKKN